jgi:hypothetical protein
MMLAHGWNWAPGVMISIVVAIAVALAVRMISASSRDRDALRTHLRSRQQLRHRTQPEFIQPTGLQLGMHWVGLSWVSVWMLLFNVVVPTVPRYAVLAALASVTAVPAAVLVSFKLFPPDLIPDGVGFLSRLYLPVSPRRDHGVRRCSNRVHARRRGDACARAWQLQARGTSRRRWHGRGVESDVHRLLARPAAIKLIRASGPGRASATIDAPVRA